MPERHSVRGRPGLTLDRGRPPETEGEAQGNGFSPAARAPSTPSFEPREPHAGVLTSKNVR